MKKHKNNLAKFVAHARLPKPTQEQKQQMLNEFQQYTWLFYSMIQGADFALLQLQDNPIAKGTPKHGINKDRRIMSNILNRLGHKKAKAEDLTHEHTAFMAQCMLYISQVEGKKLEWVTEQVYKICLASKNIKINE